MTMTHGEKLAYQRGNNRARARHREIEEKLLRLAKGYRALSRRPQDERKCAGCDRWLRGDGENNSDRCMWGVCQGGFEWDAEARAWVDRYVGQPQQKMITHDNFGCVNWTPRS